MHTVPCTFFSGGHLFLPVFDVSYDSHSHDASKEPPWTSGAILAVAGKTKVAMNIMNRWLAILQGTGRGFSKASLAFTFCPVIPKKTVVYNKSFPR